ncbi:MAG: LLM class flavin-dependent oxidoreductase [Actinomycetota bacterium]|nr:LLM class flavin-dependent oxidoreductase [Actinomycetota bacterium]
MDVGIGLPNAVPGLDGRLVMDWARSAEERGFSTLGTIDRVLFPNYESLIVLAAAAAVTERIRLMTDILISPLRNNTPVLAKQAASLDNISGGRLVLGLAPGVRDDDYKVSGVDFAARGRILDEQLAEMTRLWAGESVNGLGGVGPETARAGGPEVMIGGAIKAAYRRAARYGSGWTMGGGTPDQMREGREALDSAWSEAGRDGRAKASVLTYFSLGPNAKETAYDYILTYYGAMGDDVANMIADSVAVDEETVAGYAQAFEDAGADELVYFPCSTDPEQVEALAGAVGDRL